MKYYIDGGLVDEVCVDGFIIFILIGLIGYVMSVGGFFVDLRFDVVVIVFLVFIVFSLRFMVVLFFSRIDVRNVVMIREVIFLVDG